MWHFAFPYRGFLLRTVCFVCCLILLFCVPVVTSAADSVEGVAEDVAEEEEACFFDQTADDATLKKVLAVCEQLILETDDLLRSQEIEEIRTEYEILLLEREIVALSISISLHESAIAEMDATIADLERSIADLDGPAKTGLDEEHGDDADDAVSEIDQQLTALRQERDTRDALYRQHQALVDQLRQRITQKEETLAYQASFVSDSEDQIVIYENRANTIRNRVFGLRNGSAMSFEQAMRYAKQASDATGVRAAFILGLLKNESNLGHNIGTGVYRLAMHPTRDLPVFPHIVTLFGYDVDTAPVSADPGFGWGGAMGPAQFIPSTWVCYAGMVNSETNSCLPTVGVIRGEQEMSVGSVGDDVQRLRQFLVQQGLLSSDEEADDDASEYTHAVGEGVVHFQEQYADRILTQYGRTRGTGTINPATRNAINQLDFYGGQWTYDENRDVIRRYTRSEFPSNPWNPRDALFASAIYLRLLGADTDECGAARRYYAGGNWQSQIALNYCHAVIANARSFEHDSYFLAYGGV